MKINIYINKKRETTVLQMPFFVLIYTGKRFQIFQKHCVGLVTWLFTLPTMLFNNCTVQICLARCVHLLLLLCYTAT